jgi:hypothetical protein
MDNDVYGHLNNIQYYARSKLRSPVRPLQPGLCIGTVVGPTA